MTAPVPGTILVIEDHPLNLQLVVDLLEDAGFRVHQAEEAESGLRLARAERPDLVLMDIQLPGMDGLKAIAELHGDPSTRSIPVLVFSAHAMQGDRARALASGAAGYITKPIDTRSFVSEVSRHLTGRRDGEQAPLPERRLE